MESVEHNTSRNDFGFRIGLANTALAGVVTTEVLVLLARDRAVSTGDAAVCVWLVASRADDRVRADDDDAGRAVGSGRRATACRSPARLLS